MRQHLGVWGGNPSGSPEGSVLWRTPAEGRVQGGALPLSAEDITKNILFSGGADFP